jgi:hypothetical protein
MYANRSYLVSTATGMPLFGSTTGRARRWKLLNISSTFGSLSVVERMNGSSIK